MLCIIFSSKIRVNTLMPGITATPFVERNFKAEIVQIVKSQTPRGQLAGMHYLFLKFVSSQKSRLIVL